MSELWGPSKSLHATDMVSIATAAQTGSTYFVTTDRDLLAVRSFAGVRMVSPSGLLQEFR